MKKNAEENLFSKVLFRKWKINGDIIALFPEEKDKRKYTISSYQHFGQHADVDYDAVIKGTVPAIEAEYTELLTELKAIGYIKLRIMNRCRPKFY